MQESKNGKDEAAANNNHGTYYDLQVTSFLLFLGRRADAAAVVERARQRRIAVQIEPDGRQPLELARTNGWSYSSNNLDGLTELATLADRCGVDLWHYATPDGRSLRKAILFLAPYAFGEKKWEFDQINAFNGSSLYGVLRRAAPRYEDAEFQTAFKKLPALNSTDRTNLTGR
jgi:hypothetical protein